MSRINLRYTFSILVAGLLVVSMTKIDQNGQPASDKLRVQSATVRFVSDAPLERIEAVSRDVKGIISTSDNRFAFSLSYSSFDGFNSPLQKEHFNENFMQSAVFKKATFSGRIIDPVSWTSIGRREVRVKGILDIHGVKMERILPAQISIESGRVSVTSNFMIRISDHDITIPSILNQKIAENVNVSVDAVLSPREI